MNKADTTKFFDVDEFQAWLVKKGIALELRAGLKTMNAIQLAKKNMDKIPELESALAQFFSESLHGSPKTESEQESQSELADLAEENEPA